MSITRYEVKCNRCGAVYPPVDMKIISYRHLVWTLKHLSEIGWKAVGRQEHYCPDCVKEQKNGNE